MYGTSGVAPFCSRYGHSALTVRVTPDRTPDILLLKCTIIILALPGAHVNGAGEFALTIVVFAVQAVVFP